MAQAGGSVRKQWQLSNAGCAPQAKRILVSRCHLPLPSANSRCADTVFRYGHSEPVGASVPGFTLYHDAAASHPEAASSAVGTAAAATAAASAAKARVLEAQGHLAWLRPR